MATAVFLALGCDDRPAAVMPAADRPMIDSLFAPFAAGGMPGASVLVMRGDDVVVSAAYGLADVDSGTAATPATSYRLASLSKQFTATAVVLLAQDGTLSLDSLASAILPELPPHASTVTVRHLLTHTSGLWEYEDFVPDNQTTQVSDLDALRLVGTYAESLHFAPGSDWRYSNTGYALLALIVERVSGQRYADFVRERVFAPLEMSGTVAHEEGRDTIPHRAWGHTIRDSVVERTDQSATSAVLGDGGIYSSINDLAHWVRALERHTLVRDSFWQATSTPHVLTNGRATEYGFGWFIDRYKGHHRMRHHGETRGFTNFIARFPDDSLTIIVLTNRNAATPWDITDAIADRYLR